MMTNTQPETHGRDYGRGQRARASDIALELVEKGYRVFGTALDEGGSSS